jgi:glutamine amidotransferase
MCRLYAMHANEPTRVECSLVLAQNALMAQSMGDREGLVHGHGWGVADYPDGQPMVEKQVWAAFDGEHFAKKAAKVYARTVVAHVRRATVGVASPENTHPFHHGHWIFAHNGTVPHFDQVRERLLEATDFLHRTEIRGETDSEHVFRYLLTLWQHEPERDLLDILHDGTMQMVAWCREIDPEARIGLNLVLTNGQKLVGSRLGRTLWFLERDALFTCDICGKSHIHHHAGEHYRAVEIASETLTAEENWKAVPDATVYAVDPDYRLRFRPLEI